MTVGLRSAQSGDREHLAALLAEYLYEFDGRTEPYPYFDDYWQVSHRLPFLIEDEGEVVGLCLIRRMATWWSIAEFYVQPTARRRGIGRRAVAALVSPARDDGATYLEAKVHHGNAQAVPFWTAAGFVLVSDRDVTITRRPLSDRTLVLIGPLAVGKSTVAKALAARLARPRVEMDDVRWAYYDELGYNADAAAAAFDAGRTPTQRLAFTAPYEVHAIEQALAANVGAIVDFGASNSCIDDAELLNRVAAALAGCAVVLLLPSPDDTVSGELLAERFQQLAEAKGEEVTPVLLELSAHFIRHPANRRLADLTSYTLGRSPEQICEEILTWLLHR